MFSNIPESEIRDVIKGAFSEDYYLERYPDVAQAGMDPLFHYIHHGWKEGRNPSLGFDSKFYVESNPDVAQSGINPLYHYVTTGMEQGRRPVPLPVACENEQQYLAVRDVVRKEFNQAYYTEQHPFFHQQLRDPLDHFLLIGSRAGWDPTPEFSVSFYLLSNDDVRTSGVNPFYHYLVEGRAQGRIAKPIRMAATKKVAVHEQESATEQARIDELKPVVAGEFDELFYLDRYRDIREAGINPLEHFLKFGWQEGRDPSAEFSTRYYLESNPDIQACGINPLYHYITAGRSEGRLPRLPGGHVAQKIYGLVPLEETISDWRRNGVEVAASVTSETLSTAILQCLSALSPRLMLSIGHDDYRASVGGVQYCILLEQAAANKAGVVYLNINPVQALPVLSREQDLDRLLLNVVCNGDHVGVVTAADCLVALAGLQPQIERTDMVVHAMFGHAPEFIRGLASSAVTGESLYWVHDYLSVCPGYNLLRNSVRYCGAPGRDSMACSICVYGEERQRQYNELSALFDSVAFKVVCPSELARELWQSYADLNYRELVVQPHTRFVDRVVPMDGTLSGPIRRDHPSLLRVAFLGHPEYHKGWPVFVDLVQKLRGNPAFEFHHFSQNPSDSINVLHTPVAVSDAREASMTEALTEKQIDLALIWSVWPETYCLTAHEAVAAGTLVLTNPDSGNVARLVAERHSGLIMQSVDELLDAFTSGEIFSLVESVRIRQKNANVSLVYGDMSVGLLCNGRD